MLIKSNGVFASYGVPTGESEESRRVTLVYYVQQPQCDSRSKSQICTIAALYSSSAIAVLEHFRHAGNKGFR